MHDIKFIRENPLLFDKYMQDRGISPCSSDILSVDELHRKNKTKMQNLQNHRNIIAKQIAKAKTNNESIEHIMHEAEETKRKIEQLEKEILEIDNKLLNYLVTLPNIHQEDVPIGKSENDNKIVKTFGVPKKYSFTPKHHYELGEDLKMMDFKQAAKISGSRFVILKDDLAKLERALADFMLDLHTKEFGYQEIYTPVLVKEETMFNVGQLPKFDHDSFKTTNSYRLIPTSEVTLTSMVADSITPEVKLPFRFVAYTQCFRSEAGSAGKDTRGMLRQHQFSKVELVSITIPEDSNKELKRMLNAAETVLQKLDIPYRISLLCTQDIGFCAAKTYDIEVWLPGQDCYREISSCSNCRDFQARRMKARYKSLKDNKNHFVHTLNGSGLAIGRTIIAIMENYQNEDGSIIIPQALQPYMNGQKKITQRENA